MSRHNMQRNTLTRREYKGKFPVKNIIFYKNHVVSENNLNEGSRSAYGS
jgi:hypothetical protein